jgi:hypothetical protein
MIPTFYVNVKYSADASRPDRHVASQVDDTVYHGIALGPRNMPLEAKAGERISRHVHARGCGSVELGINYQPRGVKCGNSSENRQSR